VQLFQAFDAAIRGLPIGGTTTLEAKGGEWKRDLLFEVLPSTCNIATPVLTGRDVNLFQLMLFLCFFRCALARTWHKRTWQLLLLGATYLLSTWDHLVLSSHPCSGSSAPE